MVSSSSSSSSDESRGEPTHTDRKKRRDVSPNQERRSSRKEPSNRNKSYRDSRENREFHRNFRDSRREGHDSHRDRQRDRDRDNRDGGRRDHSRRDEERQNGKRKYDRSPVRRDHSRSRNKSREHEDRNKRNRDSNEYKRRDEYNKSKKSGFDEVRVKKEPSPEWGKPSVKTGPKPKPQEKEKPNFELSGKLTEDTNTVNGVIIKYAEPQDARKPKRRWRLYPFKGEKALPTLYVHRQSAYLLGRDRKVADIPLDHPSCSKQHAALQYRLVSYQKDGGAEGRRIRPYLIDLESANGTFVNNVKLEPRRFHELLERDVIRFGFSSREYVLLHEHSKDDSLDDDVPLTSTA